MKPTFSLRSQQGFLGESLRLRVSMSVRTGFVFICCVLTFSCGQQDDRVVSSGPARLALMAPQTGVLKDEGRMLRLGASTAIYEAREQERHRNVEMVVHDSPCNAERAALVARRVAADSAVCAVIGYLCAEAVSEVLPIYAAANLALLSPTVSAEYVRTPKSRHLFSLMYGDSGQAAFLAAYVKKGLGLNRVAVLNDGSVYGELLRAAFIAEAEHQDLEVVAEVAVAPEAAEISRATELLNNVNPEAIFLAANVNAAGLFLLERYRQQLAAQVLGPDRLADLDLLETVGQAAEGLLVCQPTLFQTVDSEGWGFVQRFEMLHKRHPDWIAAAGYDAMRLALEVLQRSGPQRADFLQALRDIAGSDTSFHGLGGPVFFRKDGTSRRPFFVATIHRGELQAAKPTSVKFP